MRLIAINNQQIIFLNDGIWRRCTVESPIRILDPEINKACVYDIPVRILLPV